MSQKTRSKKMIYFLSPSTLGVVIYIIVGAWLAIEQASPSIKGFLHNFRIANIDTAFPWLYAFGKHLNSFLSLNSVNKYALFIFWLIVGGVMYIGMHFLGNDAVDLKDSLAVRRYMRPAYADRNGPLRQFIESNLIRIAALMLLFLYIRFTLNEYASWLRRHAAHGSSVISVLLLVMLGILAVHGAVLLLRLVFLKNRLVGETMVERE
jgi:hypothetical protein